MGSISFLGVQETIPGNTDYRCNTHPSVCQQRKNTIPPKCIPSAVLFLVFHDRYEAIPEYVKPGTLIGETVRREEKKIKQRKNKDHKPTSPIDISRWKEKKILPFEAALPAVVARTITSSRIDTAAKEEKSKYSSRPIPDRTSAFTESSQRRINQS